MSYTVLVWDGRGVRRHIDQLFSGQEQDYAEPVTDNRDEYSRQEQDYAEPVIDNGDEYSRQEQDYAEPCSTELSPAGEELPQDTGTPRPLTDNVLDTIKGTPRGELRRSQRVRKPAHFGEFRK
jgi:phosphoglycolate phosphatase-like HAD superfamily hydrolase